MCFPFLTLPCVSLGHIVLVCEAPLDLRELSLVCILFETFLRPLGKELYQSPALLFFLIMLLIFFSISLKLTKLAFACAYNVVYSVFNYFRHNL